MKSKTITGRLAALVANAATFLVAYPAGTNAGTFYGGVRQEVGFNLNSGGVSQRVPAGFALAFGATGITVTNNTGAALAAGAEYRISLDIPGAPAVGLKRTALASLLAISLGAPLAASANAVCLTQTPVAAGALLVNGAMSTPGGATLDVARAVSITAAANDAAKVFTIVGLDEYDKVMVETITGANAGTVAGKKAFKRITSVSVSAATAGAITVGTTDVIGLPVFMDDADFVLKEMEDGTVRTNGTFVAGDRATPTATTGDVRGTYDPNAATNGALSFRLWVATALPEYLGQDQYAG